jgi:hypothetical protein
MIWTESKAIEILSKKAQIEEKDITFEEGLSGLRECGAFDYLIKHCGYKSKTKNEMEKCK